MTIESLGYINDCLQSLNIPYQFKQWKGDKTFPFFVGEYIDITPVNEDGLEESTLLITGTTDGSYMDLMQISEMIKSYFPTYGRTEILTSGSGIAVSFDNSNPIPTMDQGFERIQINLHVKEWRVNNNE